MQGLSTVTRIGLYLFSLIIFLQVEGQYQQSTETNENIVIGWQKYSVTIYGNARVSLPLAIQRLPRTSLSSDQDAVMLTVTDNSNFSLFINGTSPIKPSNTWRTNPTFKVDPPIDNLTTSIFYVFPEFEDNPFTYLIDTTAQVISLQLSFSIQPNGQANVTSSNDTITIHVCRQVVTDTSNTNYNICGPSNVPPYITFDSNIWINFVDKWYVTGGGRTVQAIFPFHRITYPGSPSPSFQFQITNYETNIGTIGGFGTVDENVDQGFGTITYANSLTTLEAGNYTSLLLDFISYSTIFQYDIGYPTLSSIPAPRVRLYGAGTPLGSLPLPDWMNTSVLFSASPPEPAYDYVRFSPTSDGLSLYPLQPWILVEEQSLVRHPPIGVRGLSIQRGPVIEGWRKTGNPVPGPVTATVTITVDQPSVIARNAMLCSLGDSDSVTIAWPAASTTYDEVISLPLLYDTDPFNSGTIQGPFNETLDYVSCTIKIKNTKGFSTRFEQGSNIMNNGVHNWWNTYTVLFCRVGSVCTNLTDRTVAIERATAAGYNESLNSPVYHSHFGFVFPDGGIGGAIVVPGESNGLWRSSTGDIAIPFIRRTMDPSIDFVGPAKVVVDMGIGDTEFLFGSDFGITTAASLLKNRKVTITFPAGDYRDTVYYTANPSLVPLPTNNPSTQPSVSAAPLTNNSTSITLPYLSFNIPYPPPQGYMDGFVYNTYLDPRVQWFNITFPKGNPFETVYPAMNYSDTVPHMRLFQLLYDALGATIFDNYRYSMYNLYLCRNSTSVMCPSLDQSGWGVTPYRANIEQKLPFLGFSETNIIISIPTGGWGEPGLRHQISCSRTNEDWSRTFNFYINLVDPTSTRLYGIDLLPDKVIGASCYGAPNGLCYASIDFLVKDPFAYLPSNIDEFNLTYTIDKSSLRGWAQFDSSRSTLVATFRKFVDGGSMQSPSPSPGWQSTNTTSSADPIIVDGIDFSSLQNPTTGNVISKLRFVVAVVATSRYAIQRFNAFPINTGNSLDITQVLYTNNTWTDVQYATNQAIWGLASADMDISNYVDPVNSGMGIDLLSLATDYQYAGNKNNFNNNNGNPDYQGLLTQRLATNDDVSLFADLWVTSPDDIYNPLQHGIPIGSSSYFVPNGVSDSRPNMKGKLPNNTLITALPTYNFKGIDLAIAQTTWMIRGVPMEPLLTRYSQAGRTPLHSLQNPHAITLYSNSSSILVPAGTLIPGYAYSADADITFTASLTTDYSSVVNGFAPTAASAVAAVASEALSAITVPPRLRQLQSVYIAPFISESMLVLRIDDQKGPLVTGIVYLDEIFLSNYTVRQSIGLPHFASDTLAFTLPSISSIDPHGQLELTTDNRYALLVGYNATVNSTVINSTKVARTIVRIRNDGFAEYLEYNTPIIAEAHAVASDNGKDMYIASGRSGAFYVNTSVLFNRTAVSIFQPFQSIDSVSIFQGKVILSRKGYAYSMFLNDTLPFTLQLNDDAIGAINIESRGVIYNAYGTEMWAATIGEGLVYMKQVTIGMSVMWNRQTYKPSLTVYNFLDIAWSPDRSTILVVSDSGMYGFDFTNQTWKNNGNPLYSVGNGMHLRGIVWSPRSITILSGSDFLNNGTDYGNYTNYGNNFTYYGNSTNLGNFTDFGNYTFYGGNYSNYTTDIDRLGEFVVLRMGNGSDFDANSLAVPLFFDGFKLMKDNDTAYTRSSGVIDLPTYSNSETEPAITLPKVPEYIGQVRLSRDRTKIYFVGLDYSVPFTPASSNKNTGQAVIVTMDLLLDKPNFNVFKLNYTGLENGSVFGSGAPYPSSILCLGRDTECYISWSNVTGTNSEQAGGIIYVPSLDYGCNATGSLAVTKIWDQSSVQSLAYLENNPVVDTNPVANTGLYFQRKEATSLFNFYSTEYPTSYTNLVNASIFTYQSGCNAFVFMNRNLLYLIKAGSGLLRATAPPVGGTVWQSLYYSAGVNRDVNNFIDLSLSVNKEFVYVITTTDVYVFSTIKLEFLNGGQSIQSAPNGTTYRSVSALLSPNEKLAAKMKLGISTVPVKTPCTNVSTFPSPSPSPIVSINATLNATLNSSLSGNITIDTSFANVTLNTTDIINSTNITEPIASFAPRLNASTSPLASFNISSSPSVVLNDTNITVSSSPQLPSVTPSPTSASQSASWTPVPLSPSSSISPAKSPFPSISSLPLSPSASLIPIAMSASSTPLFNGKNGFTPTKYVREFATVSANSVHSALMYVHMNPYNGRMDLSSTNGTALLTRFNITTSGWTTDTSLTSASVNISPPSLYNMLAWSVGNGFFSDSMFSQIVSVANNLTWYTHYVPIISALNMTTCRVPVATTLLAQSSVTAEARLSTPAWILQTGILGGRLGLPIDQTCNNWNLGIHHLLTYYTATNLTVPIPRTAIAPPIVSFRVDVNGILRAPNRTNMFVDPVGAQRNLLQLTNNAAWYGTPLAAATTTNYTLVTALPTGNGAENSLSLYTFYADGEGGLNWLESVVYSSPALVGDAAKDPVAVTNYVTEVTKTITTASVQENPFGSLLAVKSLGGLLSNASSSSLSTNTTGNNGQNITSEIRANNTALRTSLVSAVLTAVTTITSTSTSTSNLPPSTNVSTEVKLALRSDTSIAVDDGTVATAATALTSLTSDPTELSTTARTDALQALETLLTFSLPTNVLYGAVDETDTLPTNTTTGASLTSTVPVFPVSAATDMLGVMVNVISVDDVSSQVVGIEGAGEVVDAKAVAAGNFSSTNSVTSPTVASNSTGDIIREKVNSVLRSLSAAVLRSAEPGDPPVSIASGPSNAFAAAVSQARRLSDNATLEGYCGPGLSITTARLSTQSANETAINLENPMVPCYAVGSANPTMVVSNVEPPKIKLNQGFFTSATSSRVLDISMVQNGRSPVPETVGFRSMRFSTIFTGSAANLAESSSANTTTTSTTNGRRRLSTTTTSGSGSIQSAIASAGLSLSSGNETKDLDPTSGLDSRVISVNLQSRSGRKVEVSAAKEPIYITIPLKDPVKGSNALQLQSSYRRIGYNVTCPRNSVGASAGSIVTIGSKLTVSVYYLNSNGTRDINSMINSTTADVVGVSTLTYLAKDTSKSSYFGYTVGTAVKLTSASVYVISVACGDPVGTRNITCGPEFYGQTVSYECPDIGLLPLCAYWDESLRRWSTAGCSIAKVTDTSIVCACNHLTEFAARFTALADEQRDIFARSADIFENPADLLEKYPHVFIIIGIIFSLTVVSFIFSWVLDKRAAVKFYETLLEDEEVQFLARIEELKGNVFILDRILDSRKAAISDEIKAARLELEAKRIAEEHGLVYMRRTLHETELLKGNSLFSTIVQRNKKVVQKVTQRNPNGGPLILSDGSSVSDSSAGTSSAASNDSLTIHIANPMLNTRKILISKSHLSDESDTENSSTPTPSSPITDLDKIASSSLMKKRKYLDPYTAALYLRVTEAFDSFKVRASSVKEEYRAGVISKDMAQQFGVEEEDLKTGAESSTNATPSMIDRGRALVHSVNKNFHDALRSPHRDSQMDSELDAMARKAAELEYSNSTAAEVAGLRGSILHKAREKIEKLEESGTWSIVRAWRLRNFIFRMWFLKVWFNHLYLSIFTKYDPRLSRTARTLLLASALLSSLFCTAFFFAFRNGGPGQNLPPLELIEVVVVSILSALMQQPITMGINILITRAGTAEFTYRYPYISAEIQRRKDAEARLAKLSKKQLETELRSAARERSTEGGTLRGALTNNASHALGASGSVSSSSTVALPETGTNVINNGFEISTVIDMTEKERPENFSYGWMDPPASCVERCSCLLRVCHRHPSQKAAYIKFMAEQEAKARAAREKKLRDEKLKRKQQKVAQQQKEAKNAKGLSLINKSESKEEKSDPTNPTIVAMPNVLSTVSTNMLEAKLEEKGLPNSSGHSNAITVDTVTNTPIVENDLDDSEDDNEDNDNVDGLMGDRTASATANATMDDMNDNHGRINGDQMGDCSVSCVACLCGMCGARRTAAKEMKKRRRSLRNLGGGSDTDTEDSDHRRRSINWSTLFSGTSTQHEMKEAMEHSAKIVEKDEIKRAATRRQNRLLYFCRLAPFTMLTVIAYSVSWAIILFFLYYLFLFGLVQSKEVTLTFTYAFLSSQAMSALIVQPGVMFATTLFTFAILPAWLPYVIWIPIIGPILAGKTAAALSSNDGSATLTGRMENLTLVRAAGAASALTPDAAMVAYGVTAIMGAALSGVNQAAKQVLHGRDAAMKGGNEPQNAFAAMTAAQRHELIVRRYLVAQLRAAEAARKEQLALARARALAFSVGQAAQAFKNVGLRNKLRQGVTKVLSPVASPTTVRTPIGRGNVRSTTKTFASIAAQAIANEHAQHPQHNYEEKQGKSLLSQDIHGEDGRIGYSGVAKTDISIPAHSNGGDSKEQKDEEKK